jgi:histidyl-tRNA synthetase
MVSARTSGPVSTLSTEITTNLVRYLIENNETIHLRSSCVRDTDVSRRGDSNEGRKAVGSEHIKVST